MTNENETRFDHRLAPMYRNEPRFFKVLRLLFGVWAYAAVAILMLPLFYFAGLFTIDGYGAAFVAVYLFFISAAINRGRRDLQIMNENVQQGVNDEHP